MRVGLLAVFGLLGLVLGVVPVRGAPPPSSQPASRSYPIKLHRPAKAGERYSIKLHWTWSEADPVTSPGGRKEPRTELMTQTVDLSATAQTLAVDGRGFATRTKFVLTSGGSVGLADGTTQRLDARETLIAAWNGKKLEVTCGERALSREVAAVLGRALPGKKAVGTPTADDVYGTTKRQRVGWEWDVNRRGAVASFRRLGIEIPERELEGEGRLLAVEKVNGEPCVKVGATFRADGFATLPLAHVTLPAGLSLADGSFHAAVTVTCPVSANKRVAARTETARIAMTLEGLVRREPTKVVRVVRETRQVHVGDVAVEGVAGVKD